MQGSKSEFFQKSSKNNKRWDDGVGKKQDNRKQSNGNQKRRANQNPEF